jgi:PIN domain nuclease of toxin-antitoxin system
VAARRYLLNTSALLTLMEDEPGAGRVAEVLAGGGALISWVALLEVHYIVRQEQGAEEAHRRCALTRELPADVIWDMDEATVLLAAHVPLENLPSKQLPGG